MCPSPSLSCSNPRLSRWAQREDQGDGIEDGRAVEADVSMQVTWLLEDPAQTVIRSFPTVVNETPRLVHAPWLRSGRAAGRK